MDQELHSKYENFVFKVILDAISYKEVHVTRILKENLQTIPDITIPSLNLIEKDGSFKQLIGR